VKPGDLVKLTNRGLEPPWVTVSWTAFAARGRDGLWDEQDFEAGTLCVFLGDTSSPNGEYSVSSVLIDGRVGWVWPYELEAV